MNKKDKIKLGENAYKRYIEDTKFFEGQMNIFYKYIKGDINETEMNKYLL